MIETAHERMVRNLIGGHRQPEVESDVFGIRNDIPMQALSGILQIPVLLPDLEKSPIGSEHDAYGCHIGVGLRVLYLSQQSRLAHASVPSLLFKASRVFCIPV